MQAQQEEEDASKLMLGEEFSKAKCLMNAEVALILEKKVESLQEHNLDALQQMHPVLEKSLQYVKCFRQYENPEAVKQVREVLAGTQKLHEYEVRLKDYFNSTAVLRLPRQVSLIANLAPDTVDEVRSLVPSLNMEDRDPKMDDDDIENMLQELRTIRSFE